MNRPDRSEGTVAVVILTYNEERNLPQALSSVVGWADEVFVFDSFSTDRTVEIAQQMGATVMQHPFENYAQQRNAALDRLPIQSEWILFLDADEWVPQELKDEIREVISSLPEKDGFYLKRRFIWMGRWIRRGYYPTWILRLVRRGKGRCEERQVNEHLVVDGPVGYLKHDFIHEDRKGVSEWIAKHVKYAQREADELFRQDHEQEIPARFFGTQAERKRWIRQNIWGRLPPLVRPWFYFFYRLVLRGGFLDGRRAVAYHFLHALWFPMLIDIFYLERCLSLRSNPQQRIF
ncbi:MAG: glycosyltransferase family 2 protein [Chloroflexi bacterium]|nr:MAG: glycosyltransferase family 2 protein [Chloroflexota bacterium]